MKVRFVVASVVGILVLAGCTSKPQLAGAAAVVGDTRIAQSQVATLADQVLAEVKTSPSAANAQAPTAAQLGGMIVDRLVLSELLHQAGDLYPNLAVTTKQVQAFRDDVYAQYGEQAIADQLLFQRGIPKAHLEEFIEDVLIEQTIMRGLSPNGDQNAQSLALGTFLNQEAQAVGVRVAPRYGVWDATTSQSVAGDNTLSFPIAPTY